MSSWGPDLQAGTASNHAHTHLGASQADQRHPHPAHRERDVEHDVKCWEVQGYRGDGVDAVQSANEQGPQSVACGAGEKRVFNVAGASC